MHRYKLDYWKAGASAKFTKKVIKLQTKNWVKMTPHGYSREETVKSYVIQNCELFFRFSRLFYQIFIPVHILPIKFPFWRFRTFSSMSAGSDSALFLRCNPFSNFIFIHQWKPVISILYLLLCFINTKIFVKIKKEDS